MCACWFIHNPQWLKDNGASHPKIVWPAYTTVGGVRGAVALDDIEVCALSASLTAAHTHTRSPSDYRAQTDEKMLCIPTKLMISPPQCLASPEIAHVYKENADMFRGDDDRVPTHVPTVFTCVRPYSA